MPLKTFLEPVYALLRHIYNFQFLKYIDIIKDSRHPACCLFIVRHTRNQKGTAVTAVVPQPISLGHFVPKSRVWGGSPTSIFAGPGPAKNLECGYTRIACCLCAPLYLVRKTGPHFFLYLCDLDKSGGGKITAVAVG